MESMSIGVPVVGTDVRGTRDLLREGGGVLYPVGDVEALAKAMEEIVTNPSGASHMGASGRQSIGHYDFKNVVRMHEAVYARALGLRGAGVGHEIRAVVEADR
jgi:glycosyltransferase involved in cell wall biosynthesis